MRLFVIMNVLIVIIGLSLAIWLPQHSFVPKVWVHDKWESHVNINELNDERNAFIYVSTQGDGCLNNKCPWLMFNSGGNILFSFGMPHDINESNKITISYRIDDDPAVTLNPYMVDAKFLGIRFTGDLVKKLVKGSFITFTGSPYGNKPPVTIKFDLSGFGPALGKIVGRYTPIST